MPGDRGRPNGPLGGKFEVLERLGGGPQLIRGTEFVILGSFMPELRERVGYLGVKGQFMVFRQ